MMTKYIFPTMSALVLIAGPLAAQDALTGVSALDDRIDEIQQDAQEDLNRGKDAQRFGPLGVPQGWSGSIALSAAATTGNTDTGELSLAGRLTYGVDAWTHNFGFAGEYGQADDTRNKEKIYATYEANRYFSPELYAFGTARAEYDGFATDKIDGFLGFGPGYRVVNSPDVTWRVQAGPGIRYTESQAGQSNRDAGWIASSRFYYAINETTSLTNDTDILGSDRNTVATNDLGLNFKMTNTLSMRVSYRTEYDSKPAAGFKATDNTLGASVVASF